MSGIDWILTTCTAMFTGLLGMVAGAESTVDEEELAVIRRAKAGDSRAFDGLVKKYQRGIYHLAMRMMLNHQDADDVVQEAFIKAYVNLESYSEQYKFYTWLYRIAMNTALTMLKQRHRGNPSLDTMMADEHFQPAVDQDVEKDIEYADTEARVRKALDQIHPELRSVFVLRTWGELSYQEIADTLDVQIGTVMSRLSRARGKLQHVLREIDPDLEHRNSKDR
jgi:RNA polymerase sigma-70 factor, ECF subfamily